MQNPQVSSPDVKEHPTPGGGPAHLRPSGGSFAAHQLRVALEWYHRGEPVGPASSTTKAALEGGFGTDATPEELARFRNLDQIQAWFTGRWKRAHVALFTRRLVVVDCDMRKPGAVIRGRFADAQSGTDVLEALARDAGADWPETYEVLTPSGGLHLYFLQPEGEPIGCATGDGARAPHIGPLVDVRGVGGYVIAAGSYSRAQGRPYQRVSPPGLAPQPVPGWLLAILRRPDPAPAPSPAPRVALAASSGRADRYAAAALQQLADKVAAAPDGERWRTLSGAALRLAELSHTAPRVLAYDVVLDTLTAAAAASGMSGGYERAERAVKTAWDRKASHALGGAA